MATIKVKFKPSTVADHEGTIYYQILHERITRQLFKEYHIFSDEWDSKRSMVISNNNRERKSFISSIRERIRWDVDRLTKIVRRLDNSGIVYSSDDVIDEFNRYSKEYTLFNFMEGVIVKLKQKGQTRTSETYTSALNNFKKFLNGEDIMLDSITGEVIENYEAWNCNI